MGRFQTAKISPCIASVGHNVVNEIETRLSQAPRQKKFPHCVLLPPASRIIEPKTDAHPLALQRVENYFWKRSTIEFAPFYFNLFSSSKTLQNA